jgi:hypothetical protein
LQHLSNPSDGQYALLGDFNGSPNHGVFTLANTEEFQGFTVLVVSDDPVPTPQPTPTPGISMARRLDVNEDGRIDSYDLLLFLENWHHVVEY